MNISLITMWGTMAWFAKGIVFVMAIMSILSLGVALNKWIKLRKMQRETAKFAPEFSRFLQEEQMEGAIGLAAKYKNSHVARVLAGALDEIKPLLRDNHQITANDINSAERAIERNTIILMSELKRGSGILATVGATAPFVGLLGTTMGIVNAFQAMAASGSGGIASVGAGISEALITTAFGLMVAIPAVWLYNYFQTKADFLSVEMTYSGKELVDYLIKGVGSEFGRSTFTKDFPAKVATGSGHINQ